MSPYATDAAFRAALEQRLLNLAQSTSVNLDRLRRQVVLERLLARFEAAEPGLWVLKGAMALEIRLGRAARATIREQGLIDTARAAAAVRSVFAERATDLPLALPPFPTGWPERYERIAREHDIAAATFDDAVAAVTTLWGEMFPPSREDSGRLRCGLIWPDRAKVSVSDDNASTWRSFSSSRCGCLRWKTSGAPSP